MHAKFRAKPDLNRPTDSLSLLAEPFGILAVSIYDEILLIAGDLLVLFASGARQFVGRLHAELPKTGFLHLPRLTDSRWSWNPEPRDS